MYSYFFDINYRLLFGIPEMGYIGIGIHGISMASQNYPYLDPVAQPHVTNGGGQL
jgi:hypothetical protein